MIGSSFAAWLADRQDSGDGGVSASTNKNSPVSADLFGSVCYTYQHGRFRELTGDLTRLDARLDICSASALAKRVLSCFRNSFANSAKDPISHPRLNLIFQQQVCPFVKKKKLDCNTTMHSTYIN